MHTRIPPLLAGAALLAVCAASAPAHAQNPTIDSRWIAYLGCWHSIGSPQTTVCIVPAAETAAVDLVTIENGEVARAEQLMAGAKRVETVHGECTGWQSAEWSAVSDRLYLHSEESCPGWGTRTGTGLLAMTRDGQVLYIQGSTVGMKTGVRVQRYREVTTDLVLPSEVKDALDGLQLDLTATTQAHAAATAPLAVEDIAEASRQVDLDVVEAWLVERGTSFTLDAKRLVTLAKAGVPSRITDLMIALSYPGVFVVDASAHRGARRESAYTEDIGPIYPVTQMYDACGMEYGPFPYGSYYCDGFASAYPYEYGFYPREYPVVIIYTGGSGSGGGGGGGGGASSQSHGQVVNGRGYQEGPSTNSDVARSGEPRSPSSGGSTSTAATPSQSSSSSSGEQRTAKPRP